MDIYANNCLTDDADVDADANTGSLNVGGR